MLVTYVYQNARTEKSLTRMVDTDVRVLVTLFDMYAQGLQTGQATRNVLLNSTDATAVDNYKKADSEFLQGLEELVTHAPPGLQAALAKLGDLWKEDRLIKEEVLRLVREGKKSEAGDLLLAKETPKWREVKSVLLECISQQRSTFQKTKESEINAMQARAMLISMVSLLMGAASVILALLVARSITGPLATLATIARNIARGDFDDAVEHQSRDEIGVLADSFRDLRTYVHDAKDAAQAISEGNLGVQIVPRCDRDELSLGLQNAVRTMRDLIGETGRLTHDAIEGRLESRGDVSRFKGGYRELVQGINATLDAVIAPLDTAARCVDQIGRGLIPTKITEPYRGSFNTLKNSINACIDGLDGLVEANAVLQRMAVNDYSRRIEGTHVGVFDEVTQAVNGVQVQVKKAIRVTHNLASGDFSALPDLKETGKRSEQDEYVPALVLAMENVHSLVLDVNRLAGAAVDGLLHERADVTRHQGEFRHVVEGVNATLDAVIGPLDTAADYVNRIGRGDIPPRLTGHYGGDFDGLKKSLNACIDGLGGLIEANVVLQRMAVNDYREPVSGDYVGVFGEVKNAVNGVQERIKNITRIMKDIAQGDLDGLPELRGIGRRSEHDELLPSVTATMESVSSLVTGVNGLNSAATKGDLGARADATRHRGQFRQVIEGRQRHARCHRHPHQRGQHGTRQVG